MPNMVPLMHHNVGLNKLSPSARGAVHVRELRWGCDVRQSLRRGQFDVILGSDLTYSEELHAPLLATLLQLVSDRTEVLLAVTRRRQDEVQRWRARFRHYFDVEVLVTEEEVAGYRSMGVIPN